MRLGWFFIFFLLSGFSSLVDQVVWLRLAMAQYGVTTPLVSIVISVFMGGLALGSWSGGWLAQLRSASPTAPLRLYGVAELVIGSSALLVPAGLSLGRRLLFQAGDAAWGSLAHHALAGVGVTIVMLPFCTCMGATLPLGMQALRNSQPAAASRSFSYLYLANVVGATLGTLSSAFVLIELLGFRATLLVAAAFNLIVGLAALLLARKIEARDRHESSTTPGLSPAPGTAGALSLALLFATGLVSMGMEVVWVRQFTAHLGSVVYTFAIILGIYLTATALGSAAYRRWDPSHRATTLASATAAAAVLALLPLVAADPRLELGDGLAQGALRVALGIFPFCAALGFLTPMLVDRWSAGDAARAGRAYALNVVGCILGPLLAGFGLLPFAPEHLVLLMLAAPLMALALAAARGLAPRRLLVLGLVVALCVLTLVTQTQSFETHFRNRRVLRDSTATAMAVGRGPRRELLVNGVGMTGLTPITKMMVHLPLAFLREPPQDVLVICFGMGTSFRSALSWGVRTTSVELVPSVPRLFGYFHEDADAAMRSPLATVVIDDGRRFLERSAHDYDAIVVDAPPPPEAAGSSLLYSREFYALVRVRLRPGGVLQQWLPGGDAATFASVTRALRESFPHVRAFPSLIGVGIHFLASDEPLPFRSASALAVRLPAAAVRDMLAWGPHATAEAQFEPSLAGELDVEDLIALAPQVPALADDRPVNEYYFLRRLVRDNRRSSVPARLARP